LLDVGCGNGSFLNNIQALTGSQVYGVDVSKAAAHAAKEAFQLDIFTGTILDASFPDSYFDVITAWSYLEHLNAPARALLKIASLLKPGGCFIMNTPNFDSLNSKLFKDKWYHLDCPRHLYLYTPKTIAALLDNCGLNVEKIIHHRGSKAILGSLQYYFYRDNYHPDYRNKIRRSYLLRKVVWPWARLAAMLKRSDTFAVFCQKK
jgi:SAM-dependent methyltransferase